MKSYNLLHTLAAVALAAAIPAMPARAQVAAATDWDAKPVPNEVWSQFPGLSGPDMSPDGNAIAAKVRSGGVQVLAILPLGDPKAKPEIVARDDDFSEAKVGDREIYAWDWIDDDNLLIGVRSRDNYMGFWYDNTRVAAYNRKTKKMTPLGWDKAIASAGNVLWRSPPGTPNPRIVLARQTREAGTEKLQFPEVIEIAVETGRVRTLARPTWGITSWGTDQAGVLRFGSSFDRDTGEVRIMYRANAEEKFRTIVRKRSDMHSDIVAPSLILADSNKAYALSNHEGYRAAYEYDLDKLELGKKLYGVDGYDLDGLTPTPDGKGLQSYGWTADRDRVRYLDPRLHEIQQVLEESFGKGNVRISSTDTKREKIIFLTSAPGQAPVFYVFDTESGDIKRLAWFNETLKNAKLNPVRMIRYKASDGKEIEAVLTVPRHRAGQKNLPILVMPHGGPWQRDSADWDQFSWAQAAAEWGYVVIQPNFRGSSGYGRDWMKASQGSWGFRMQDDLNDAVDWLAAEGIGDPKRACMMGWSYGGYAASRAAQRDGAKYRCAISGAGVHDLPAMVNYDKDYLGEYGAAQALGSAGKLREVSPGLYPEQYSIPILIVHGARDQRVPVAQSRELVSRLKKAGKTEGKDFIYLEQKLNTHHLPREDDRLEFLNTVKKFLAAHNPA